MTTYPHTPLTVPPLESGDRLNRDEFERRYAAMPKLKKAELIEGVVYVAAALRFGSHAEPHSFLMTWLGLYFAATPGVRVGDNPTVRLDHKNAPQPDGILRLEPSLGGRSHLSSDDYIEGPPELVVEVSASTATADLQDKKAVYCRHGVKEYIVWQVFDRKIDWFYLEGDRYVDLPLGADGVCQSRVFPGLWLDREAMVRGDLAQVLSVVQQGLQSLEHKDFLGRLNSIQDT
ncbi:Uma2 family endonuclease [Nodosilinea sp. P-1105]|uniref:Uma2 family endonuclease n=1 Tax=Nodosilinea sp. P-1105 TaxID=2546229 RepID=UPI00146F3BAB|nr:Uma2 family endonuclease [Nodosilinea sp. P-1105]NMF84414.1 Uma2 family endonuclease [Nodosilinea sp. P-1105]